MNYVLDDKNRTLLGILKENSRESFTEIAKRMGMSEGAIRKRVKNLVEEKAIARFTIETSEMQRPVRSMIMVKIEARASSGRIVGFIKSLRGVDSVHPITGAYDICAGIGVDSNTELYEIISSVRGQKGVVSTSTMNILS